MRWNKKFDGTKEALMNKSHKPLSPHPNSHTAPEFKWISDYHRRNPKISVCELYGELRANKGYSRHPGSLYRVYRLLKIYISAEQMKSFLRYKMPESYYMSDF